MSPTPTRAEVTRRQLEAGEHPLQGERRKIDTRYIVGTKEVRHMCGGVSRPTFAEWRANRGFPKPIRALKRTGVELWDANDVRAWLRATDRKVHSP